MTVAERFGSMNLEANPQETTNPDRIKIQGTFGRPKIDRFLPKPKPQVYEFISYIDECGRVEWYEEDRTIDGT